MVVYSPRTFTLNPYFMFKKFFILSLAISLFANGLVPMVSAEDTTADSDATETLVVGESCNEGSGYVFDAVGLGLTCVEIGTAVPDTDCILTADMGCEDLPTGEDVEAEVEVEEDVEIETEELDDEVFYDEGEVEGEAQEEGEVVVEVVSEDDYNEATLEAFNEANASGDAPDTFYLSVRWGYFLEEGMDRPNLEATDWDGVVDFNGLFALPVKTLRFEPEGDAIDFESSDVNSTFFNSEILNATDGLLFKVKTNLDVSSSITFDTAGLGGTVDTAELLDAGVMVLDYGDYNAVFRVWTPTEWVSGDVDEEDLEEGVADDAEKGAWYENFMNYSIGAGFFGGDRDSNGNPMGTIRPADEMTRFELIKVESEMAFRLKMGVGVTACNPKTVEDEEDTDWMGDHWARGYVQCIQNSGMDVKLLDEIIDGDVKIGNEPALRIEVVMTGLDLLGITPESSDEELFTDSDELSEEEVDALNYVAGLGVIGGYPDGHFGPYLPVNRAEMFKIISLFYQAFSL